MMKELPPSEYDRQVLDCADWTVERLLKQGDSRIMGAFGYRAEGNLIRREKAPICDYLDLEYYRGSPKPIGGSCPFRDTQTNGSATWTAHWQECVPKAMSAT